MKTGGADSLRPHSEGGRNDLTRESFIEAAYALRGVSLPGSAVPVSSADQDDGVPIMTGGCVPPDIDWPPTMYTFFPMTASLIESSR